MKLVFCINVNGILFILAPRSSGTAKQYDNWRLINLINRETSKDF